MTDGEKPRAEQAAAPQSEFEIAAREEAESVGISQTEIDEYLEAPDPELGKATRRWLRRWLVIYWHGFMNWFRRKSLVERLLYMVAYLWLPVQGLFHVGWNKVSASGLVFLIVMQGRKAWNEFNPRNMKMVERNYLERKTMLRRLVGELHRHNAMTPAEIHRFQVDALSLIVAYVRDHRADTRGKAIFANLVILEGDEVVVVARNQEHRNALARYAKDGMLVGATLETGEPRETGDVYSEFPQTPTGKPYKSILSLPVHFEGRCVGAVSIDSSLSYHFSANFNDLCDYLNPYVALLAWTLSGSHANQWSPEALEGKPDAHPHEHEAFRDGGPEADLAGSGGESPDGEA